MTNYLSSISTVYANSATYKTSKIESRVQLWNQCSSLRDTRRRFRHICCHLAQGEGCRQLISREFYGHMSQTGQLLQFLQSILFLTSTISLSLYLGTDKQSQGVTELIMCTFMVFLKGLHFSCVCKCEIYSWTCVNGINKIHICHQQKSYWLIKYLIENTTILKLF